MADTITASIGWGGAVFIHNGTTLYELKHVRSFKPPYSTRERVDATHLKSAGRRREMIPGLFETTSITVSPNYRPGSDTATLLPAAVAAGDQRDAKFVIPLDGDDNVDITCDVIVTAYEVDDVQKDEAMIASVTLEVVGAITQAASA